jgi:ribulose-phosphate 3-epimerase
VVKISTSILSKPNADTIINLNHTSTDYIHLDVMDGIFVPNKIFSIQEIESIFNIATKPLDIHLMVQDINPYLNILDNHNVEFLTFHYEVLNDINMIDNVKSKGIKCGISVKPNTDIKLLFPILDKIDLVLIMGEEPGKGGQPFINESLDKIILLKEEIIRRNLNVLISIDGGINDINAKECIKRGIDILVVGTYITNSNNYEEAINKLKN